MAARDLSIDVAKGFAIIAIVFGHVWRGLDSADLIENGELFSVVDHAAYTWHLSVFAFTAGLFVQKGMRRDGSWRYALDRDLTFLWLYTLWSLLQGLVKIVASSSVNSPTTALDVLQLWFPDGQLWFFGWIALMMVIAAFSRPWESLARTLALLTFALTCSLVTWGWSGSLIGTQGLGLTMFFVLALLWRGDRLIRFMAGLRMNYIIVSTALLLLMSLTLGLSGLALTPTPSGGPEKSGVSLILGIVASSSGLAAVLLISNLIGRSKLGSPIAFVGKQSLAIFLAHIVFASGTRILLVRLGVDGLLIQVLAGTAIGVLGPLALVGVSRWLPIGWLFDSPKILKLKK